MAKQMNLEKEIRKIIDNELGVDGVEAWLTLGENTMEKMGDKLSSLFQRYATEIVKKERPMFIKNDIGTLMSEVKKIRNQLRKEILERIDNVK